jgi:hypothetical protein
MHRKEKNIHRKIEKYTIFYNIEANEGHFIFHLEGKTKGTPTVTLLLASPQEGTLILDILRNEQPVYYDEENRILISGLHFTGIGKGKSTAKRAGKSVAKSTVKIKGKK